MIDFTLEVGDLMSFSKLCVSSISLLSISRSVWYLFLAVRAENKISVLCFH